MPASRPRSRRLDVALQERGLVESVERARVLIMAGEVRVAGERVRLPSRPVREDQALELITPARYVSRGGEKLGGALDDFGVAVEGRVCADVGASTGGFTDVLLQRGAARVYAIDVGRGQLHWRLRQDDRVVLMEGVNARLLESLPEPVGLITVDVSFIGLEAVMPALRRAAPEAEFVVLFKPQFQVPRGRVEKGGVVRDENAVAEALAAFERFCEEAGVEVAGRIPAALKGPAGNQEHLLHLLPRGEAR